MERAKSPVFIFINASTGSVASMSRDDFPIIPASNQPYHTSTQSVSATELNPYNRSSTELQREAEAQLNRSNNCFPNHAEYHSTPPQQSTHCALNPLSGQPLPPYRPMLNPQMPPTSNRSTIHDSNSLGHQLSTSQYSDNTHISNSYSLLQCQPVSYSQAPSFSSPPPYESAQNSQNSVIHTRPPPLPPRPRSAYLQRVPVRTPEYLQRVPVRIPEFLLAQHWSPSSVQAPLRPAQSSPTPEASQSYTQPGIRTHHLSTGISDTIGNTGPFRCPRCGNGVDESAVPGWRVGRTWVRFCMVCRNYT